MSVVTFNNLERNLVFLAVGVGELNGGFTDLLGVNTKVLGTLDLLGNFRVSNLDLCLRDAAIELELEVTLLGELHAGFDDRGRILGNELFVGC